MTAPPRPDACRGHCHFKPRCRWRIGRAEELAPYRLKVVLVENKRVNGKVDMHEAEPYGRTLAKCHVWPRSNLNADMVRFGFALAYRQYSDNYVLDEGFAKQDNAGMWSGNFAPPWEWRRKKKLRELQDRIERALKRVERDRI